MSFDLTAWSQTARNEVDTVLRRRFGDVWPESFREPLVYPLFGGGKRVRPLLALAAAESLGRERAVALDAAAAVELVHTYSLVHDDLPAMDDDDERRGRPTLHKVYNDGMAVLVGDALLTEAFAVLAESTAPAKVRIKWVSELARAAGALGMVGGQVADVTLGASVSDVDTLVRLHALKTGALIQAALVMGALAADAGVRELAGLATYGAHVGLAFQLADDVLDAHEAEDDDGPPSFVRLIGLEATRTRAERCVEDAIAAIAILPNPDPLVALAHFSVQRSH